MGQELAAAFFGLAAARGASILFIFVLALISRQSGVPAKRQLAIIALVGVSDTAGNAFFALATSLGRLDIAAILGSLYPAVTILLARFLLHESISRQQWLGIGAALAAVVLITV